MELDSETLMTYLVPALIVGVLILGIGLSARGSGSRNRSDLSGAPRSVTQKPPSAPSLAEIASQLAQQPGALSRLDPRTVLKIGEAIAANRKLEAIKLLREASGLGLKEAKEAIEAIR